MLPVLLLLLGLFSSAIASPAQVLLDAPLQTIGVLGRYMPIEHFGSQLLQRIAVSMAGSCISPTCIPIRTTSPGLDLRLLAIEEHPRSVLPGTTEQLTSASFILLSHLRGGYLRDSALCRECDSPFALTNLTLDHLDKRWSNEIDFVICAPLPFVLLNCIFRRSQGLGIVPGKTLAVSSVHLLMLSQDTTVMMTSHALSTRFMISIRP